MSRLVRERLQRTVECMESAVHAIETWGTKAQKEPTQKMDALVELLTDTQDLAIAFGARMWMRGLPSGQALPLKHYRYDEFIRLLT